jgi:glutaredoxin-like YruB-family protein
MAKIKMYSTSTCPYCTMAKEFLRKKGVEFDDINVGLDRAAASEMIKKTGHMGVPQIEINGKMIIGFDKAAIEKELAAMQKK